MATMATKYALAALVASMMAGAPALAQSVPADQSCGGLLCDMGVFGHKTEPKQAPPQAPVHAAVAPPPVAAEPADPEPTPKAVRKKKHVAKAAAKDKVAPREADASEARPVPVASVAKPSVVKSNIAKTSVVKTSVVKTSTARAPAPAVPVPFGWQTAVTQPPVAPAAPQAEPPVAPAPPQVAQAKPKPADGSMPVNVINLYSSLPSAGIRPLY